MGHDFAAGIELMHALRQVAQRDEVSVNVADLVFMWLAHVEDEEIVPGIQPPLQFFYLYFRDACLHCGFLPTNSTKLVVVYQLRDGGMGAAHRAVGILPQLQLAELHAESIDQQQPSDQRLARAQNEFDHFRSLHHSNQAGQNTKHSAFRARRHQPRRWRLGIQAAIARTIFRSEDTGLPFKAENRSVHVGLAGDYTGVIDQVARGEIVSTIGNDVEVTENFQCVIAAQTRVILANLDERVDCF